MAQKNDGPDQQAQEQPDQPQEQDGFSPEERAQFDAMRAGSPEAEVEQPQPVEPQPQPEPAPQGDAGAGAYEEADDGEDDGPAGGDTLQGQPQGGQQAPDLGPDGKPLPADQQRHPRRVPFKRYDATVRERDEARAEAQRLKETQARLDERLKILTGALTTPQVEAPVDQDPEPDPDTDIIGHSAWLRRQLAQTQQAIAEMQRGGQEREQAADEQRTVETTFRSAAAQFAAKQPAFMDGYNHLLGMRMVQRAWLDHRKNLLNGGRLTPQEEAACKAKVAREERFLILDAMKRGEDPAEAIYNLAQMSGFQPAAAGAQPQPNGHAQPNGNGAAAQNGAARQPAPRQPAQPNVTDEIRRIQQGQDASLSLSGGGGAPNQPMTAEKLANMSQDEFDRWRESHDPHELAQLMGG